MVPLYFAKHRPVVVRDGMIMLVDAATVAAWYPERSFRTSRCAFARSAATTRSPARSVEAETLEDIILELVNIPARNARGARSTPIPPRVWKRKNKGYF